MIDDTYRHRVGLAFALLAAAGSSLLIAQQDATRAIVPEAFLEARPEGNGTPAKPVYKRVTPGTTAVSGSSLDLGVTLWRLRTARQSDPTRLLLHEAGRQQGWAAERVRLDQRLIEGDRVRITIESPRDGYLYVIDSEEFADGTRSPAYLIFPTRRIRGGDNKLAAGRILDIPDQDDAPPYLTLKPSRSDTLGERLTVIVSSAPLANVAIGDAPLELTRERVTAWEKRGGAKVERFEMESSAGKAWSAAEQDAARDGTRRLTRVDPPPQTLLRLQPSDPAFIAVPIVVGNGRRAAAPK
jgi:hypothetical protein